MQKRLFREVGWGLLIAVVMFGGGWRAVGAQGGGGSSSADDHLVTLLSVDAESPALFELLAPGDEPTSRGLQPRLVVSVGDVLAMPLMYVAVENSGWSQGAIGLISETLDPEADYVALEVRNLGMAGYVVREDGQTLVFPLSYESDLDGAGTAGFRFDILIGEIKTLRVFRVVEDGGLMLFARENTLTAAGREQERVTLMIDPQPVFGDLLFECHIEALPGQVATFTPTPEVVAEVDAGADSDGDNVPDAEPTPAPTSEPTVTPDVWIAE